MVVLLLSNMQEGISIDKQVTLSAQTFRSEKENRSCETLRLLFTNCFLYVFDRKQKILALLECSQRWIKIFSFVHKIHGHHCYIVKILCFHGWREKGQSELNILKTSFLQRGNEQQDKVKRTSLLDEGIHLVLGYIDDQIVYINF